MPRRGYLVSREAAKQWSRSAVREYVRPRGLAVDPRLVHRMKTEAHSPVHWSWDEDTSTFTCNCILNPYGMGRWLDTPSGMLDSWQVQIDVTGDYSQTGNLYIRQMSSTNKFRLYSDFSGDSEAITTIGDFGQSGMGYGTIRPIWYGTLYGPEPAYEGGPTYPGWRYVHGWSYYVDAPTYNWTRAQYNAVFASFPQWTATPLEWYIDADDDDFHWNLWSSSRDISGDNEGDGIFGAETITLGDLSGTPGWRYINFDQDASAPDWVVGSSGTVNQEYSLFMLYVNASGQTLMIRHNPHRLYAILNLYTGSSASYWTDGLATS